MSVPLLILLSHFVLVRSILLSLFSWTRKIKGERSLYPDACLIRYRAPHLAALLLVLVPVLVLCISCPVFNIPFY